LTSDLERRTHAALLFDAGTAPPKSLGGLSPVTAASRITLTVAAA
jgi:hypothetical protein